MILQYHQIVEIPTATAALQSFFDRIPIRETRYVMQPKIVLIFEVVFQTHTALMFFFRRRMLFNETGVVMPLKPIDSYEEVFGAKTARSYFFLTIPFY